MRLAGRNTEITLKIGAGTPVVVPANNFTIDMSKDTIDATNYGDPNKVELKGIPSLNGDVSGFFDTQYSYIVYSAALGSEAITMEVYFDKVTWPTLKISGPINLDAGLTSTVDGAWESNGTWSAAGTWDLTALTVAFPAPV